MKNKLDLHNLTEDEKRYIRAGYYRKYKIAFEESQFDTLSKTGIRDLIENGRRNLTLLEKLKENIGGIIFICIVLGVIAYTLITLAIMTSDYNRIAKVEACDLLKELNLTNSILPNQVVSIQETGNSLGAASDCWVRVKSGNIELVAVAYIRTDYEKLSPRTISKTGEWRGIEAQEFIFEDNFYRGTITTYKATPESLELTDNLIVAEKKISETVGTEMISRLPKNENIDSARRGLVWGWLFQTFFDSKIQGSLPNSPQD